MTGKLSAALSRYHKKELKKKLERIGEQALIQDDLLLDVDD